MVFSQDLPDVALLLMIPPPIYHYNMLGDVLVRNQIIRVPNIHDTYDTEEQVSVFIAIKIYIYI